MWALVSDMKVFWRGAAGLAMSFWVIGFCCTFLVLDRVGLFCVSLLENPQLLLFYLGFLKLAYIFVVIGIWRSAGYYTGAVIWAWSARLVSVAALCRVVLSLVWFWQPDFVSGIFV